MALLLLLLSAVYAAELPTNSTDDLATASSGHVPRNIRQYLEETYSESTTKQGPVLFPNDAPPPPRPPLIVTSRPLSESIARSELNPEVNNSIAESTQVQPEFRLRPEYIKQLKPDFLRPRFLAKTKDYKPFSLSPARYAPYSVEETRYDDYGEEHSALPPIYKAIADAAKQKVLRLKIKKPPPAHYDYQDKKSEYPHQYQHNDVRDDIDYDHNSNYAFSYRVKDKKTGDDFSHSQHSSGSATNGEYRVRLPDGRMQIVSYTADENGYKADVRYDDDKTAENSIDYDHDRHRHDYAGNRHDYGANKHVYGGNPHDYAINKPVINDYGANKHVYGGNAHDYAINKPVINDYGANKHLYGENAHDYAINKPFINDYGANRHLYSVNDHDDALNKPVYDVNKQGYTTHRPFYSENIHGYANNRDYVSNRGVVTKPPPVKEDYNQYSDLSKEYYGSDYSSLEYDGKDDNFGPHKSKFSAFVPSSTLGTIVVPTIKTQNTVSSTVRPSYEELKPLFLTKNHYHNQPTQSYLRNIELHVPSTTPSPLSYQQSTTEHVVIIGTTKPPHLYTNVRHVPLTVTPSPVTVTTADYSSPQRYLVSTIASLKNGEKPVLSGRFIDRINKYLTFT